MSRKTWTDTQMLEAICANKSVAGVLKQLNLKVTGANYQTVHSFVRTHAVTTKHWTGQGHLRGRTHSWTPKLDLDVVCVENSTYLSTSTLKRRLLKAGRLKPECYECGIVSWCGRSLSLHLDHINGKRSDNRVANLRLLCPNCHSQTETFAGRNIGKAR